MGTTINNYLYGDVGEGMGDASQRRGGDIIARSCWVDVRRFLRSRDARMREAELPVLAPPRRTKVAADLPTLHPSAMSPAPPLTI